MTPSSFAVDMAALDGADRFDPVVLPFSIEVLDAFTGKLKPIQFTNHARIAVRLVSGDRAGIYDV